MRRKSLLLTVLLFVGCFFMFTQSTPVFAAPEPDENKVIIREPTTDVDTIYENYKDNSFELMTQDKKQESWTGIKESLLIFRQLLKILHGLVLKDLVNSMLKWSSFFLVWTLSHRLNNLSNN